MNAGMEVKIVTTMLSVPTPPAVTGVRATVDSVVMASHVEWCRTYNVTLDLSPGVECAWVSQYNLAMCCFRHEPLLFCMQT